MVIMKTGCPVASDEAAGLLPLAGGPTQLAERSHQGQTDSPIDEVSLPPLHDFSN